MPSIAIKVNAIGFIKYTTTRSCRTFKPQSYARDLPAKPVSNPVPGVQDATHDEQPNCATGEKKIRVKKAGWGGKAY